MPISFEIPDNVQQAAGMAKMAADFTMRPVSRALDENEHERPTQFIQQLWPFMRDMQKRTLDKLSAGEDAPKREGPGVSNLRLMLMIEMLSWGDAGIYLCLPGGALGGAAIEAVGTPEQKMRFLKRFAEGEIPAWGAMAMTEPGAALIRPPSRQPPSSTRKRTSGFSTVRRSSAPTASWRLRRATVWWSSGHRSTAQPGAPGCVRSSSKPGRRASR